MKGCAFTGHRSSFEGIDAEKLKERIASLAEEGFDTFYCGMALGFDMLCAKAVLELKEKFPVRLIACVPCADQSKRYPPAQKRRYEALLAAADERVVLHEKYVDGCMFERNRYMVDRSEAVVAFLRRQRGGTFYTVQYARRRGKKIYLI